MKEQEFLTIITPTYNRRHTLDMVFRSLMAQTDKGFIWIVVDDGSTDDTKVLIAEFKQTANFQILYYYIENGGKHVAINCGMRQAVTKWVAELDSDDPLVPHAVSYIRQSVQKYEANDEVVDVRFLFGITETHVLGDMFPNHGMPYRHSDWINNNFKGDKYHVFKSEIRKKYSYAEIPGEKFGEGPIHLELAKNYKFVGFNEIVALKEYMSDGLTVAGRKLRLESPIGGMIYAAEKLSRDFTLPIRLKYAILYNCYRFFADKKLAEKYIKTKWSPLILFGYVSGWFLFIYWKNKYKISNR